MIFEFKMPELGEGLTEGEVVRWQVKEGDIVKENQPLCNVLTDKAEIEIPSPKSGKIVKLLAKEGDKVPVHAPIISFEVEGEGKPPAPVPASSATASGAGTGAPLATKAPPNASVSATPAVRKLAADLKLDILTLAGTGPGGRITEADVRNSLQASSPKGSTPPPAEPAASVSSGVGDERIPFIGIRRRTAEKMAASRRTAAAVSHMDEADFTALVKLRDELKAEAARRRVRLTYLPFIIKASVKTLKEFPNFNAVLDEAGGAIVRRRACNMGFAVSSEQGLVVPVIKDAQDRDLWALAAELGGLAAKVRDNKIEAAELQGGTFTITNIGSIGGLFATPIINLPEAAILGVMKIQQRPIVKDHELHIRDMANLVLTFDHRVNDGAEAALFMNTLVKHLENPRTLL